MAHDFEKGAANLGQQIAARLRASEEELRAQWNASSPVRHLFIDDLLPAENVQAVHRDVPPATALFRKKSMRESKWVGVAIDQYPLSIGEYLLAFQQKPVLDAIASITGLRDLEADPSLYASGISLMQRGDFLNPHLDNSHDGDQVRYRVLNLLYYVSPDWVLSNGGNLELWTDNLDRPNVIESRFNRLVVMATDDHSWHSVQRVVVDRPRACFSNYYFSTQSPTGYDYRNVTSFRGRPDEPLKRLLLRADAALLNTIGKLAPSLLTRNRHRRART